MKEKEKSEIVDMCALIRTQMSLFLFSFCLTALALSPWSRRAKIYVQTSLLYDFTRICAFPRLMTCQAIQIGQNALLLPRIVLSFGNSLVLTYFLLCELCDSFEINLILMEGDSDGWKNHALCKVAKSVLLSFIGTTLTSLLMFHPERKIP